MRVDVAPKHKTKTLHLATSSAAYDIHVGIGLLASLYPRLADLNPGKPLRLFVVSSPPIWKLYRKALLASFSREQQPVVLMVRPGEAEKRLKTLDRLAEEMAQHGADRDSLLLALGGGVIGDITGFLAAIYMRGIPFVQVPSTLLACVDSSVGGKTGVNLAAGKNLVGSFHQPKAVFADIDLLASLPARELRAGLQEAIKSAIIADAKFFSYLERSMEPILAGDPRALMEVVLRSVAVKAGVVAQDERESGPRMALNFGHTLGHAMEAATGYKRLLHGEAIGWGMIAALHIARARGTVTGKQFLRMLSLIHGAGPLPAFRAPVEMLVALTAKDKKTRSGKRAFILPVGIGATTVVYDVTDAELAEAMTLTFGEMRLLKAGQAGGEA